MRLISDGIQLKSSSISQLFSMAPHIPPQAEIYSDTSDDKRVCEIWCFVNVMPASVYLKVIHVSSILPPAVVKDAFEKNSSAALPSWKGNAFFRNEIAVQRLQA